MLPAPRRRFKANAVPERKEFFTADFADDTDQEMPCHAWVVLYGSGATADWLRSRLGAVAARA